MILTDREIRISLQNKSIEISPMPPPDAYASTSVDLTLDKTIRCYKSQVEGIDLVIDPSKPGYKFQVANNQLTEERTISADGYQLDRNTLVLAWTQEDVRLTEIARVAARVEGKSSLARIGLGVHITAPTIHAGFRGRIQLEIVNHGPVPIRLRVGMRICQLIFEQTLGVPEKGYSGQFFNQQAT